MYGVKTTSKPEQWVHRTSTPFPNQPVIYSLHPTPMLFNEATARRIRQTLNRKNGGGFVEEKIDSLESQLGDSFEMINRFQQKGMK